MAVGNFDLIVVALLVLFASAGFSGAFFTLLRTGRAPRVVDSRPTLLIPVTGSSVDLDRLAWFISVQWLTPQRTVFIVEPADAD